MAKRKINMDIETIIEQYESGIPIKKLATPYYCSQDTIYRRIREYYISNGKKNKTKIPNINRNNKLINEMVKYHEQGLTDTEISKIYNCSKQNVNYKLKRYYNELNQEKKNNAKKEYITLEELINKKYGDKTVEEIAELLNVSTPNIKQQINNICKEFNINRQDYVLTNYEKTKDNKGEKLRKLYEFGYTQLELAAMYGVNQSVIQVKLDAIYKDKEKPKFLTRQELQVYFRKNRDLNKLVDLAKERNKKVPIVKTIEALKKYREDIYLYYLDNENINRYNLRNTIEKEIKRKNKILKLGGFNEKYRFGRINK